MRAFCLRPVASRVKAPALVWTKMRADVLFIRVHVCKIQTDTVKENTPRNMQKRKAQYQQRVLFV